MALSCAELSRLVTRIYVTRYSEPTFLTQTMSFCKELLPIQEIIVQKTSTTTDRSSRTGFVAVQVF